MSILYNALVRSVLEYAPVIWSPFFLTYKLRIERVQKKFTRYLYYKQRFTPDRYDSRLSTLGLLSLEDRRVYFDMCTLYKIHRNIVNIPLTSHLQLRNLHYPSRHNLCFQTNTSKNNYGLEVDIVNRLQRTYTKRFNNVDICNTSFLLFKKNILSNIMSQRS